MVGGMRISPSLICMSFLAIRDQILKLNSLADSYHVDISDGHFVPAFGLPLEYLRSIREVATVPIDVHLMIDAAHVERVVSQLINMQPHIVTVHVEAITCTAFRVIETLKNAGIQVGIAINPVTSIDSLRYLTPIVNKITILTFDPGMAGQRFVPGTLGKIAELAAMRAVNGLSFDIEVDGSCNAGTFTQIRDAGATQCVVGTSGLFSLDGDIESAWTKMEAYMLGGDGGDGVATDARRM
jgi:D-allulose-6-phosphate 3-epimerase